MSDFERADYDVISMVNENRRRSGITRTVGVIVPVDEARRMVVSATRQKDDTGAGGLALMALALFVIVVVTVGVLA